MRRQRRSRASWIEDEKGEYKTYRTVQELARFLGVSSDTIKRWESSGQIPPHDVRSNQGWRLWAPETVTRILHDRTHRGR